MAAERAQEAAQFLETRLMVLADMLGSLIPPTSEQQKQIKDLPAQLRATRRPDDRVQSLFDVARSFDRRVPLGRLLQTEKDIRPYLAAIIVAAVQMAGETLTVPDTLNL